LTSLHFVGITIYVYTHNDSDISSPTATCKITALTYDCCEVQVLYFVRQFITQYVNNFDTKLSLSCVYFA